MKILVAATVALAGGCAAFIGCAEKPVRAPMHEAGITIAILTPSSSPAASASTKPAPPADSASAHSDVEAPLHDAVRAPGEVACGKATCKAGKEACCPARGACEAIRDASAAPGRSPCEGDHAYQCDSRDDCGSGQLCCWLYGDPAAVTLCMSAPCPETEACHGPSSCAAGFTCKGGGKQNDPGTCAFAAPKTQCGKITCSGAMPVCRWDPSKKSGACVASNNTDASEDERDVQCSSSADCGGEHCCFSDGRTWCGACVNNAIACKTRADCPPQLGGGQKLEGCVAAGRPQWPSWLKLCEYGDPTSVSP